MTLTHNKQAIGVFSGYHEAENALNKLRCAGFEMNQVSVIVKPRDTDLSETSYFDEEAKTGAEAGAVVGGLTGLLVSMGIIAISGVAPIVLAGATATAIATTLAGGAIGTVAGGFVGGLVELGIPEQQAKNYHNQVINGKYLVLVDGTEAEILGAGTILRRRGIHDWAVYPNPIARQEIEPSLSLMKV
jgi:uncharacterized membrane protein